MAAWVHPDMLNAQALAMRSSCTRLHLVRSYAAGASYAAVLAASVASVAMTAADLSIVDAAGGGRSIVSAPKTAAATANSGTAPELHFVFVDEATSRALWAIDETTNQVVTAPNEVTFPALSYTLRQPT